MSEIREQRSEVIPSSRFAPHNLKAEADILSRHASKTQGLKPKALSLLPTERMARRRRTAGVPPADRQKELNASVDALTKKPKLWMRGTFPQGAGFLILIALTLINCELAARCFDSTGDIHVAPGAFRSATLPPSTPAEDDHMASTPRLTAPATSWAPRKTALLRQGFGGQARLLTTNEHQ